MSGDLIANYDADQPRLAFRRIEQKHIAAQVVEDHVHLRPSHSHPGC